MADTVAPRQLDVSGLPTIVFGHRSLIWWGTLGMMAIDPGHTGPSHIKLFYDGGEEARLARFAQLLGVVLLVLWLTPFGGRAFRQFSNDR